MPEQEPRDWCTVKNVASVLTVVAFAAALITNFIGDLIDNKTIDYVSKPLIVIPLIVLVSINPIPNKFVVTTCIFIAGLIAAWVGDISLMFDSDTAFLVGMIAFFIMHTLYTVAFFLLLQRTISWAYIVAALIYVPASAIFAYYLLDSLTGALKIAVPIYITSVVVMSISAVSLRWFGAVGAVLFALSDTALASEKFLEPSWFPEKNYVSAFVIMTYGIAQLLFVVGFIYTVRRVEDMRKVYTEMQGL